MKVLCVHDAQQVTAWWEEETDCCSWRLCKGRCVSNWEGDIEKLQKGKSYRLEGIWQFGPRGGKTGVSPAKAQLAKHPDSQSYKKLANGCT